MGVFRRLQRGKLAERYSIRFQLADGTRKTIATDATTEAQALEYLRVMEDKVREEKEALKLAEVRAARSASSKPASLLLSEAADRTYDELWSGNRTGDKSRSIITAIITMMGDVPIKDIDNAFLGRLKKQLTSDGTSLSTVNRYYAALKTVLRMAHYDWGVLDTLPRFRMAAEKEFQREFTFTDAHLADIRSYFVAKGLDEMVDVMHLLLDTGMRLGELFQLSPQHVDMDARLIKVPKAIAKSKQARVVPMTARVHSILARLYKGSTLFSMSYHTCEKRWARMREALGLPDAVIHCLRHTCATRLIQRGADLYSVQRLLGHSSPNVTTRYAHMQVSTLRDTVGLLQATQLVTQS